jgi:hypothetical protein
LTPNLIEIGCSRRGDPRTHPVAEVDRGRGSAAALGIGDVAAERVDRPVAIARAAIAARSGARPSRAAPARIASRSTHGFSPANGRAPATSSTSVTPSPN